MNNIKDVFKKYGWSYYKMFLIGPRFVKNDNEIRITRKYCVINNISYISYDTIKNALSNICENELVDECMDYLQINFNCYEKT